MLSIKAAPDIELMVVEFLRKQNAPAFIERTSEASTGPTKAPTIHLAPTARPAKGSGSTLRELITRALTAKGALKTGDIVKEIRRSNRTLRTNSVYNMLSVMQKQSKQIERLTDGRWQLLHVAGMVGTAALAITG